MYYSLLNKNHRLLLLTFGMLLCTYFTFGLPIVTHVLYVLAKFKIYKYTYTVLFK